MGVWSTLFGDKNVVSKTMDMVRDGTDKAFFTKEEKADYLLAFLAAYEPFKVAQRLVALMVGIPYVFIWVLCAAVQLISGWFFAEVVMVDGAYILKPNPVALTAKEVATQNNMTLGETFQVIAMFYFGGGLLEGGIRAWKGKEKK